MNTHFPGDLFQQFVSYSFYIGFLSMAGFTLFFFMERNSVLPKHRLSMTLSGVITFVAAISYYLMKDIYRGGEVYPLNLRYVDWTVTTPLLLAKFPDLLEWKPGCRKLLTLLVTLDLIMIITGYLAEEPSNPLRWPLYIAGCLAWLGIIGLVFTTVKKMAAAQTPIVRHTIEVLSWFIVFGWLVYPVVFLGNVLHISQDAGQLLDNIGDIVNKVGFGLVAFSGAYAATRQMTGDRSELYDAGTSAALPDGTSAVLPNGASAPVLTRMA